MGTLITVESLLAIVEEARITIAIPDTSGLPEWMRTDSDRIEVIDAKVFEESLRSLLVAKE